MPPINGVPEGIGAGLRCRACDLGSVVLGTTIGRGIGADCHGVRLVALRTLALDLGCPALAGRVA